MYLRITIDKEVAELSISRKWTSGMWDKRAERANGKNEEAKELNRHINAFRMKVFETRLLLMEQNKPVTATAIKNVLTGKEEKSRKILNR
jgi:hypothetical protein